MSEMTQDFYLPPWTLRAALAENVREKDEGEKGDFWIWFVARSGEDAWMAHGLSDVTTQEIAEKIAETIDGETMDIFISLMGEPWTVIKPLMVQHAQMQRDLAMLLEREQSELDRMRSMSTSEIEAERRRHEIEVWTRTYTSDN